MWLRGTTGILDHYKQIFTRMRHPPPKTHVFHVYRRLAGAVAMFLACC
jgi:hypothetical protein